MYGFGGTETPPQRAAETTTLRSNTPSLLLDDLPCMRMYLLVLDLARFQPPPSALTSWTELTICWPSSCVWSRWLLSSVVCAVMTSR